MKTSTTLFVPFFDIVESCRLEKKQNMWSDMLELVLCYIILGWE